jgi:hypothetical protein
MSDAELRDLLHDVADQARFYDVADAALTGARRRRHIRFAVGPALVFVAFAVVSAVRLHLPDRAPVASFAPPPAETVIGGPMPKTVLPSGPLTSGAALYLRCTVPPAPYDCTWAITLSGNRGAYRLPTAGISEALGQEAESPFPALSPTGKWLLYRTSRGVAIRQLVTGEERPVDFGNLSIPTTSRAVWSPDESQVVFPGGPSAEGQQAVTIIALPDGRAVRTHAPRGAVAGVLRDGNLLVTASSGDGSLRILTTGHSAAPALVDDAGFRKPDEHYDSRRVLLRAVLGLDERSLAVSVYRSHSSAEGGERPSGILIVDVATGQVRSRIDLDESRYALTPCGYRPDGILMERAEFDITDRRPRGDDSEGMTVINPVTGKQTSIVSAGEVAQIPRRCR